MSYNKIYKDNIVSGASIRDGKGNRIDTMYLSKDEFNIFNPANTNLSNITEEGIKVIKDNSGSGLEVCDIGMALYVDETKGLRRYLNGQIVDINANTQAFLDRLLQIKTTNPEYFTTEENWQAEALLNIDGCVYKFVLNYADDGETVVSVRLPKYPDYVEVINVNGTAPVSVYGNGMTLGLTNGTVNYGLRNKAGSGGNNLGFYPTANDYGKLVGLTATDSNSDNLLFGITKEPKKSGIVGTANLSTAQTKLKLRYFIQIATGSETENNIINEIELNNPYSLFDSKYSPHELNNLSWLKSEGQWNAKAVYPTAYDKLLKVYNGTETVEGLSVKLSTEAYTDYDFVLNTAEETFRLPLKNHTADDSIEGLTLYFYVGETVQNANLIDAGRIGEQLSGLVEVGGSLSMPSNKYINLTLGASGTTYTAPANGWFQCACTGTAGSTFFEIVTNQVSACASYNGGCGRASIPVKKGDVVTVYYGGTNFAQKVFRFTYAQGDV